MTPFNILIKFFIKVFTLINVTCIILNYLFWHFILLHSRFVSCTYATLMHMLAFVTAANSNSVLNLWLANKEHIKVF